MNKKFVVLASLSLALTMGVVSCISAQKGPDREVASDFWSDISDIFRTKSENFSGNNSGARTLDSETVAKRASSGKLPLTNGEIIIDNDAALDSKVNLIRSATRSIRMAYFIYADDDSSSIMTSELIKKAQAGVKVSLLVDFITNYSRIDFYQMMVQEGRGNIDVRFYNFPSVRIQRDAIYMTLPCPSVTKPDSDTCKKSKEAAMKTMNMNSPTFFSSLFLSGLYSKNGVAMKIALGIGGEIDPAKMKSGAGETSEEDMARMMEFLKLYFEAKVKGNVGSMIKLTIAMFMYGEQLNPIVNELSGRIPLASDSETLPGKKTTHAEEWDHITDYTHHKLIAVDGRAFQLGGRNVEDSYHMKSRIPVKEGETPKGKYIFMDTDFRGETGPGGIAAIEKSFDRSFNFREMVAPIAEVQRVVPADLAMNNMALGEAAQVCMAQAQANKLTTSMDNCIKAAMRSSAQFLPTSARVSEAKKALDASVTNYTNNYARNGAKVIRDNVKGEAWSPNVGKLTGEDLRTSEVYYVENTSFNVKAKSEEDIVRRAGSRIGGEKFYNKNIHALWYRGLENACAVSKKENKETRVILHSAYLFMPSGLIHKIAKMLNGDYGDCSRVRITLLTNSFATTDLNVINIFARYQMNQLFSRYQGLQQYAKQNNKTRFFPTLEYYEYNAAGTGAGVSLHTKLSLLGNDMIIGSANADARSYGMDTNNAVFIRNAYNMNRDYVNFIDRIIGDSRRTKNATNDYSFMKADQLRAENNMILGTMICRWDKTASCHNMADPSKSGQMNATDVKSTRFSQERVTEMLKTIDDIGQRVSVDTYRILNFRKEFDQVEAQSDTGKGSQNNQEEQWLENEMNQISNSFDDFFKVL
ncbi:hypothetical protein CIK05_14100 [Bdellovibrio sp. qaytius]|nr:hypothetical protein CIK05_14100 [Bdellovibrio sp. qaytius]